MYYFNSSTNQEIEGPALPGYVPYLSLMFSLIATTVILLLSGWVVYTIKTTISLHKPYNIFVANLIVSDMIVAVLIFIIQCSMMISYQFGVKLFLSCYAYKFVVLGPLLVNSFSAVTLTSDRVVALIFPSMYNRMKTCHVVGAIISIAWLLAVLPAVIYMIKFDTDGILDAPEHGTCVFEQNAYTIIAVYISLPMVVTSFLSIIIHVLQVEKKIDVEKRFYLSRTDNALMTELSSTKLEVKKLNMLFLVILAPHLVLQLTYFGRLLFNSLAYQYVIASSVVPYALQFLHSLVFVLYFKQARQPVMKYFVRMKTVNSVTPCTAVV